MLPSDLIGSAELDWLSQPAGWRFHEETLTIAAGPGTDWFVDPAAERPPILNAPALVGEVDGDFMLSARVSATLRAQFDAGALMVHADSSRWTKLCFERSPSGEPMVVSVVTRESSDDCNSFAVEQDGVWLRISRLGDAFAFHASVDGRRWALVRVFALPAKEISVGFEAQSPAGDGCTASFSDIRFARERLADLRNGT